MAAKQTNPFERLKAVNEGFSSRSQASHHAQWALEIRLKSCGDQIARTERKISETNNELAQMIDAVSAGRYVHPERIAQADGYVEGQKRVLAELRKRQADIQRDIAALTPTGSQKANRIKAQTALCQLGGKRFETELEIIELAAKMRVLLERRHEFSAGMLAMAAKCDLSLQRGLNDADALDEDRFKALLKLVPPDMERISREWAAWFTGEGVGQTYIVRSETLEIQETLASPGAFRRGDRVRLTRAEAARPLAQGKIAIMEPVEKASEKVA